MPVSLSAQLGSKEQADVRLAGSVMSALRVSMPGIVQSFDPDTVTVVVQPAIKGYEPDSNGINQSTTLPLLVDVPVVFPRGGGCTLTFPVKAGDECLVVFADRCIDFWWQNGGVQEPVDDRMHDLSDAFCIVGPQSQAQKISGISTSAAQLRTDDGAAFVEVAQAITSRLKPRRADGDSRRWDNNHIPDYHAKRQRDNKRESLRGWAKAAAPRRCLALSR